MKSLMVRALTLLLVAFSTLSGLEAKTLGIVALIANDALNVAVIAGATDAAKAAGWGVKVVDGRMGPASRR
jgi:ribose transport system substrate-binding protein